MEILPLEIMPQKPQHFGKQGIGGRGAGIKDILSAERDATHILGGKEKDLLFRVVKELDAFLCEG
jgi:hypothetical protein